MTEKTKFIDLAFDKQDMSKTVQFIVKPESGVVICKLYDREYNMMHRGKARCGNTDKFDERIGRAIAFNKARKKELTHNLRMINQDYDDLNNAYFIYKARLDKREEKYSAYLEEVNAELNNLLKD